MALVKTGGGVSQLSGKSGGVVYARNKSGAYQRNWAKPINPNTTPQQDQRARLAQLAVAWSTVLSLGQRDGWILYASGTPVLNRLGDSVLRSGFNWFVGVNSLRLQAGLAILGDAPLTPGLSPTPSYSNIVITDETSTASNTVTVVDPIGFQNNIDGALLFGYIGGKPLSTGVKFYKGPWQFCQLLTGDSGTPPDVAFGTQFSMAAGQVFASRFIVLSPDGKLSPQSIAAPVIVTNVGP